MIASRRWQDWTTTILGVLLFIAPFVFGETSNSGASWTAYVGGVVVFLLGLGKLVMPEVTLYEYGVVLAGIILFFAPWVVGFAGVASIAWTAWIFGVLLIAVAGTVILGVLGPRAATTS